MEKKWTIAVPDEAAVQELRSALKIHPVLCTILAQRGITSFSAAKFFFRPELEQLYSPWLMKDMDNAVSRILKALETNEKILIFGDYDVDGTTAVAVMYRFLKTQHPLLDFYLPHRYKEGYGISKAGIDFAKENDFSLVIALDCGIKSADLIDYANLLNIDFIICDHHLPDATLPKAVAVLNPKRKDCTYPYKELCGCGVGYKLITALCEKLGLPSTFPHQYLDLVATAIAADIVPITGENRILAFYGLLIANKTPNPGIKALAFLGGAREPLHIYNLVFMIAPRVNAAGRMDDARKAVQLFVSETYEEALTYAELLHNDNSERKEADASITEEALELILQQKTWITRKSTVVYQPHWHKGVVGIVASRLIEHHYRPTVVLTESGGYVAGSARSVPGFNLYEAIHACREYLLGYGGHFAAAGLTLHKDHIDAFREKFEEVVAASITEDQLMPVLLIDAEIRLSDITDTFYNIIRQMEPFGPGNMTPVFVARGVKDDGSRIVKEKHLRFKIRQENKSFTGIGFQLAHKFSVIESGRPFDIVFKIDENEWQGQKNLQLRVEDVRTSDFREL